MAAQGRFGLFPLHRGAPWGARFFLPIAFFTLQVWVMTPAIINGLTLLSRKAMGDLAGRTSAFDGKHRLQRIFAGIHHFIIQPLLGFFHKITVYKNSYFMQKNRC